MKKYCTHHSHELASLLKISSSAQKGSPGPTSATRWAELDLVQVATDALGKLQTPKVVYAFQLFGLLRWQLGPTRPMDSKKRQAAAQAILEAIAGSQEFW